jgi:excisionase family DNA binding protein
MRVSDRMSTGTLEPPSAARNTKGMLRYKPPTWSTLAIYLCWEAANVPNEPNEPLLTPGEVAAMFRVDPKTVTRWARDGKLSAIRTLGGHRRYRSSEVKRALALCDEPAQPPGSNPSEPGAGERVEGYDTGGTWAPVKRSDQKRATHDCRPTASQPPLRDDSADQIIGR